MRFPSARRIPPTALRRYATKAHPPLIRIENATFYREPPPAHRKNNDSSNPPLFPNLNFTLDAHSDPNSHWAVLSLTSAHRTAFLQILRGNYLCVPPAARSYPYLSTAEIAEKNPHLRNPQHAIQYVGFDAERGGLPGGASTKGAYMSARYESMRDVTDWSVRDYLLGNTALNVDESLVTRPPEERVESIMRDLGLDAVQRLPVSHLSNGQTRRARIAKALLASPELLLLDGPFMGLDPYTLQYLSGLLHGMAEARQPRLVLSLRPQEFIPRWITHFIVIGDRPKVSAMGDRKEIFEFLRQHTLQTNQTDIEYRHMYWTLHDKEPEEGAINTGAHRLKCDDPAVDDMLAIYDIARKMEAKGDFDHMVDDPEKVAVLRDKIRRPRKDYVDAMTRDGMPATDKSRYLVGEIIVQMKGVQVAYNDSDVPVLGSWKGGLYWDIRRGQRWGVFGPNGSGKTTLLSLMTSDHPQAYSQDVRLFGRSRLPEAGSPGISVFELQSRIGHCSPEVHSYFPKHLSVRRVLESAWADTPISKPRLSHEADEKVNACLRWFRKELCPEQGDTPDQRGEAFNNARKASTHTSTSRWIEITETTLRDEEALMHPALDWADKLLFRDMSFSAQRVALFLRAIIKAPDLIILDEAFSGMDELARDKCMLFLNHGETMTLRHVYRERSLLRAAGSQPHRSALSHLNRVRVPGLSREQALVVVAHSRDDVPGCVRDFITLREAALAERPRYGRLSGPLSADWRRWAEVWGVEQRRGRTDPPGYEAVMGPYSPAVAFGKSLNLYTDIVGMSSARAKKQKKLEAAAKSSNEDDEDGREGGGNEEDGGAPKRRKKPGPPRLVKRK